MVVASVWQLLAAIFIVSALLKLVYRLARQDSGRSSGLASEQQETVGSTQIRIDIEQLAELPPDQHGQSGPANSPIARLQEPAGSEQEEANSEHSESERQADSRLLCANQELISEQVSGSTSKQSQISSHRSTKSSFAALLILIAANSYLIEPCSLIFQVLKRSIKLLWSIIDSIEGIESTSEFSSYFGAQSALAAPSADSQPDRQQINGRRSSNYFHRRYTSRRSLSAALLEEEEEIYLRDTWGDLF